jgi:hypothetical protein
LRHGGDCHRKEKAVKGFTQRHNPPMPKETAMKKLLPLLLASACTLALAEPAFQNVPEVLQKPLLGNGLTAARMQQGVLQLQMGKPEVTELVYATFVFHSICAPQWRQPQAFAQAGLARVELLNADASQGYAFDARGDVCARMGQMGQNYRGLITQHTSACTAQGCPPQR